MPDPINDCGAAFPSTKDVHRAADGTWETHHPIQGMSLRDYFAAKAMQVLLNSLCVNSMIGEDAVPDCAFLSYKVADAMIATRGKEAA